MFKLTTPTVINPSLIAVTLALSAFSISAQARLTNYKVENTDLVYSSVSDVTWTKDANLLGTWIFSSTDADRNGTVDIIDAIIAATPSITETPNGGNPTGIYTVTSSDFDTIAGEGRTTWYGAMAFVSYLNSIRYGGKNSWYLPTVTNTNVFGNGANNGTAKGDEFSELFNQENITFSANTTFDNIKSFAYWTSTELPILPINAFVVNLVNGRQDAPSKGVSFYTWAVSPGQIAAVPEPESLVLLLFGLGLVGGLVRSR